MFKIGQAIKQQG